MRVSEIMTRNIGSCHADTRLQEVARMMLECDCGAIPVIDEKSRPIGIVTDRDIVTRLLAGGQNPLEMKASDVMTKGVATCRAHADLHDCERMMEEKQVRRIVVVDESGACCGIVSQADIARCAPADETAEVVRDISQPSYAASQQAYLA